MERSEAEWNEEKCIEGGRENERIPSQLASIRFLLVYVLIQTSEVLKTSEVFNYRSSTANIILCRPFRATSPGILLTQAVDLG